MKRLLCLAPLALAACATDQPGIQVRTVTKTVEVQKPCPGTKPERPAPLARPLPSDPIQLAAILGAKLYEWAGEGKYGDQADAIMTRCLTP